MMSEQTLSSVCLLADLFLKPDPELNRDICTRASFLAGADTTQLKSVLLQVEEMCEQSEFDQEQLSDFNRLFVMNADKVPAPMYASFWLETDQHLMNSENERLEQIYREYEGRFDLDTSLRPDHLVPELRLLAYLLEHEDVDLGHLIWLLEHLCLWVPRFVRVVRASNPHPRFLLATSFLIQVLSFWINFYRIESQAVSDLNTFIQISDQRHQAAP
jgi:TorA maturation chaperone TorD